MSTIEERVNTFSWTVKRNNYNIFSFLKEFNEIVIKGFVPDIKAYISIEEYFHEFKSEISERSAFNIKIIKDGLRELVKYDLDLWFHENEKKNDCFVIIYTKNDKVVFTKCEQRYSKNLDIDYIFEDSLQIDNKLKTMHQLIDKFLIENYYNMSFSNLKILVSEMEKYRDRHNIEMSKYLDEKDVERSINFKWNGCKIKVDSYKDDYNGYSLKIHSSLLEPRYIDEGAYEDDNGQIIETEDENYIYRP